MSVDKVAAFTEILAQDPGNAFARYGLAIEYTQRGDTALAMQQFDALEKLHPDYTAGYQMAAQTLMASGNIQQAEARLRAGIESARRTGNQHALSEMAGMLEELTDPGA
ncbi:MAG TPA: tetratricopeptide repeat protein [Acidobacteriaceae bacterium]